MMKNYWVKKAFNPENKGKLHRELGVEEGKNIPPRLLKRAEHSKDKKLAARARLADTAKHFHHRGNR